MSNKGLRACLGRIARLTSTWTLTLTVVLEVDVAVDVESIVDLDVDLHVRSCSRRPGATSVARGSRCKGNDGVEVNVAVNVKVLVKVIVEDKVEDSSIGFSTL